MSHPCSALCNLKIYKVLFFLASSKSLKWRSKHEQKNSSKKKLLQTYYISPLPTIEENWHQAFSVTRKGEHELRWIPSWSPMQHPSLASTKDSQRWCGDFYRKGETLRPKMCLKTKIHSSKKGTLWNIWSKKGETFILDYPIWKSENLSIQWCLWLKM